MSSLALFKRGDKVTVLDGSHIEEYAFSWYEYGMRPWVGKTVTILSRIFDANKEHYGYTVKEVNYKFDERGLMVTHPVLRVQSSLSSIFE